jgi:excisionase family DNA binding protein
MKDELLTPKELACELGIRLSTIYYWSHIGYIPVVKMGRLIRFRRSSINKWLEKKEEKGRTRQRFTVKSI